MRKKTKKLKLGERVSTMRGRRKTECQCEKRTATRTQRSGSRIRSSRIVKIECFYETRRREKKMGERERER